MKTMKMMLLTATALTLVACGDAPHKRVGGSSAVFSDLSNSELCAVIAKAETSSPALEKEAAARKLAGPKTIAAAQEGRLTKGMNSCLAVNVFGEPSDITRTEMTAGITNDKLRATYGKPNRPTMEAPDKDIYEEWTYDLDAPADATRHVYINNGKVSGWVLR